MNTTPTGALDGVRVADFSRVLAGPYATMLLADLGAEVIKVERPGLGDDTRQWGPPYDSDGRATYFESVNRNKQSIEIDLRSEAGRRQARELAVASDVVVENFVPGTMDRFGLGPAELLQAHPALIYASITGFGSGAGRKLPGYDLLVQAVGGLMSITGPDADHPTKAGVAIVDVVTGLHCAFGVVSALRHRERTGIGQHLEVSLLTSLLSAMVNQASAYLGAGVVPEGLGNAHPSISPYESYETADRPLVLAVGNDGQFRSLCHTLGIPRVADDPRFSTNPSRVAHRHELNGILQPLLREVDADTWWKRLTPAGVPCGPINDLAGAFALADQLGLTPVVEIEREGATPSRQVTHPVRFAATPATYRAAPPRLGEGAGTP